MMSSSICRFKRARLWVFLAVSVLGLLLAMPAVGAVQLQPSASFSSKSNAYSAKIQKSPKKPASTKRKWRRRNTRIRSPRSISAKGKIYTIEKYKKDRKGYYTGLIEFPRVAPRNSLVVKLNNVICENCISTLENWESKQDLYLKLPPAKAYSYTSIVHSTFVSLSLVSIVNVIKINTGGQVDQTLYNCRLYTRTGGVWSTNSVTNLFEKDVDGIKNISEYALPILKIKGASDVWSGLKELSREDCSEFSVNSTSITFYFAPLVLGPKSQGSFIVSIPYDKLKGLDTNGPLRYLLKRAHYGK